MITPGRSDAEIIQAASQALDGCSFDGLMRGSFTSQTVREVILSARCGEGHFDNFGSTVLLANQSGRWKVLWREAGLITCHCRRLAFSDGRDGALCTDFFSHMGDREEYLYSIDFANPAGRRSSEILSTVDTMQTGYPPSIASNIERVEIGRLLSVWVRYGDRDHGPANVRPLSFVLNGTQFEPTAATAERLRQFRLNTRYR